jgi:protein-S-isoprenylcysteine O-methyltransferase Ste14
VLITGVAAANAGTLPLHPAAAAALSILLALPVIYLFHSVRTHFGFKRACGIDHFDPSYRSRPLVREGTFSYVPNAMYVAGLLILWIPGLLLRSQAALAVAVFSHLFIWGHYLCTEKPDMEHIYGSPENRPSGRNEV